MSRVRSSPRFTSGESYQKRRGLDLDQVAHDEPLELGERLAVQARVRRADRRVLADDDEALHGVVEHPHHRLVDRVVAGDPRQVVEAEVVPGGRVRAPPGLEQAHGVGAHVAPEAARGAVQLDELLQVLMRVRVRHRDVPRAGCCTASADRSSPGSRRARAGRGCRRQGGRCCRAGAGRSRRRGCTARPPCAASSRPRSRSPTSARGRSSRTAPLRPRGTAPAEHRTPLRRAPACSGRSAAAGAGTRSADARGSGSSLGRLAVLEGCAMAHRAPRPRPGLRPSPAPRSRRAPPSRRTARWSCRRCPCPPAIRRRTPPDPRCPRSPRRRSPARSCSSRRTRGTHARSRGCGSRSPRGTRCPIRDAGGRSRLRRRSCG